jgi:VanZ family protein
LYFLMGVLVFIKRKPQRKNYVSEARAVLNLMRLIYCMLASNR